MGILDMLTSVMAARAAKETSRFDASACEVKA